MYDRGGLAGRALAEQRQREGSGRQTLAATRAAVEQVGEQSQRSWRNRASLQSLTRPFDSRRASIQLTEKREAAVRSQRIATSRERASATPRSRCTP